MHEWEKPFFNDQRRACPLRGQWVSFRLVDEFGDGQAYAGLNYQVTDSEGVKSVGILDAEGYAKISNSYCGPVVLAVSDSYSGSDDFYLSIIQRENYPLPITALQVAAEQTRRNPAGNHGKGPYRASAEKGVFYQVEVRDLVQHRSHLPPPAKLSMPLPTGPAKLQREVCKEAPAYGVALLPEKHYVLEVRALRAFRPLLSLASAFSALNLYQLSLLTTLSYGWFGQQPNKPKAADTLSYPVLGTVGHVLQTCLACREEPAYYADAKQPNYPMLEDVPYSKRLEVMPFDPTLYPQNDPSLGAEQETPSKVHFFNDARQGPSDLINTDTQAYATHDDRMVLIAIRGTAESWDGWRDADAAQVPIEGGVGKAHQGFYEAYMAVRPFVVRYLRDFRTSQTIVVCGHSLGGAIALLLAEWIRQTVTPNVILYTFGSPRAGDAEFVESAKTLTHHRMVNHNDPVPSVPAPWMDTNKPLWISGAASATLVSGGVATVAGGILFAAGLTRFGGEPYSHQGEQRHFMPVQLLDKIASSVLWKPGCEGFEEAALASCIKQLGDADMPTRRHFVGQLFSASEHSMLGGYIPACWASLRRWQEAEATHGNVLTQREGDALTGQVETYRSRLRELNRQYRAEFPAGRPESRPMDRPASQRGQSYDTLTNRFGKYQQEIKHVEQELAATEITLQRLSALMTTPVTLKDLFGDRAQLPERQEFVARWLKHPENTASVRIAQIPAPATSWA